MLSRTIIHCLSGGLDSVVMLYDLHAQGHNIHCALFNYKQRHAQELLWAQCHLGRLGLLSTTIDVYQLRGSKITDDTGGIVVPARNAIFLSLAANLAVAAGADTVTFAANKDDAAEFPDCRTEFVNAFNATLKAAEIEVEVCAPYIDRPKAWIAALGHNLGVRFSETWSCYKGGIQPCGVCSACMKREAALREAKCC